ncbi:DUF4062 domain-containing protein [Corynebacterium freiburgense]|uniref:DUF4062 domain-containing protein n=1 Tax=Corynebacterium freiburgense TaxID=556548 RepID=UPI00040140E4|nr:DUF4062 domain-containing protein [Corynebacterium freiburgense]WJZ03260.1 hypothetical protein CFREI_09915 [Corynebacterium freiburgense]
MSFNATILRILIASPSDVPEARDAVENAIHSWNRRHAVPRRIVLLPWRWETNSIPMLGAHPQAIINKQGVDSADIVVALFGSRLGSPTKEAVSGTVEEIEKALASNKPIHIFFSTAPLPHDVDTEQLEGLRNFKKEIGKRGLLGEFDDFRQLENQIWNVIEHDINQVEMTTTLAKMPEGVKFKVQPKSEERPKETDSKGRIKYETKYWLEITNAGDSPAEELQFEAISDEDSCMRIFTPDQPISLHPGVTRKLNVIYGWGVRNPQIMLKWMENNEQKSATFDI